MGLLDFFRKPKPAPAATPPAAAVVVHLDDEAVTCTRAGGLTERVRWSDLRAVLIQTTADGPFVDDLFWVLVGDGARSGCVVPSEAQGCAQLVDRLQQLPGFDNKAVILACQCCAERSFLCWEHAAGGPAGATAEASPK